MPKKKGRPGDRPPRLHYGLSLARMTKSAAPGLKTPRLANLFIDQTGWLREKGWNVAGPKARKYKEKGRRDERAATKRV
ncbi:MAG TPA: hypothetical protein PLH23_13080 [Hyphomonadaceae bacterium]|nr:hypothetical protein [Hyphomonadaceae bacterium]HPI49197.1 hypothetical protein [Hyphomonadaceae bacterium]